jgi:hypothetical protein
MRFHITIMRPEGWHFAHCFDEVAETLVYGLRALGYEVSYKANGTVKGVQNIVLGAHLCDGAIQLPEGTILYNLEQIGAGAPIAPELAARFPVWDFSERNLAHWKAHGIAAQHVPIGYVPQLSRFRPLQTQAIDVLFYGSMSQRRSAIIGELQKHAAFNVVTYQGFGRARDEFIARAKVVLNMHFYDKPHLFEWPRVSYLLTNRKCVVSETSEDDPPALEGGLCVVPYAALAEACRTLVADRATRYGFEALGFLKFSKLTETAILRRALAGNSQTTALPSGQ